MVEKMVNSQTAKIVLNHYFNTLKVQTTSYLEYDMTWKCLFKGYNFLLESFWIKVHMRKLWTCKEIRLIKFGSFGNPKLESYNFFPFQCSPHHYLENIL
jgi:hypothetical protein